MHYSNTLLVWLQDWYISDCNGDWEHTYGIKIDTLDNPGWSVEIDLAGTSLEDELMDETSLERGEHDWFVCKVAAYKFKGFGGPQNLTDIIQVFKAWVAARKSS